MKYKPKKTEWNFKKVERTHRGIFRQKTEYGVVIEELDTTVRVLFDDFTTEWVDKDDLFLLEDEYIEEAKAMDGVLKKMREETRESFCGK